MKKLIKICFQDAPRPEIKSIINPKRHTAWSSFSLQLERKNLSETASYKFSHPSVDISNHLPRSNCHKKSENISATFLSTSKKKTGKSNFSHDSSSTTSKYLNVSRTFTIRFWTEKREKFTAVWWGWEPQKTTTSPLARKVKIGKRDIDDAPRHMDAYVTPNPDLRHVWTTTTTAKKPENRN